MNPHFSNQTILPSFSGNHSQLNLPMLQFAANNSLDWRERAVFFVYNWFFSTLLLLVFILLYI